MTRKIKVLGLAFVAVLAFAAVSATGASASTFKCSVEPCISTSAQHEGEEKFFVGTSGFNVHCKVNTGRSTAALKSEEKATVSPTYSECESSVGAATVKVNHCDFDLFAGPTSAAGHAPIKVTCSGGTKIEIATGGCTISIGEQTVGQGAHYTNVATTAGLGEITTHITAKEIAYTKAGFTCGFVSGEARQEGTQTTKCYEDKGTAHPIGTEGTTPPATTEGKQVSCEWAA